MNPCSLKEKGHILLGNGYELIPIKKESKIPAISGWQNTKATPEDIENWANNLHQGGYGVLTSRTPAIDIDCHDKAIIQKVVDYCERALGISLKRVGLPPKILLVYKTEIPFKKISSSTFEDSSGTKHKVEILGEGQQFVAFGIHPETKKSYSWPEKSILEIPHNQLPWLTMEQAQEVVDYFKSIVPKSWKISEKGTHLKTNQSQDPFLNHKPPLDLETNEIKNILNKIDPDESYDRWVKAGMALSHQFDGKAEGLEIWDEWSSKGQKYKPGLCEEKWKTFSPDLENVNPITFATVLGWLKEKKVDHQTISRLPLSIDFLELRKKLGPTNWLVKDYIEQNTTGLFFGDPGSYKSFLALDIAYHCASGKDWHGCTVEKGPVYYILGEGHGGIARRQEAWIKHHEPDLSDMHFWFTTGAMDFYDAKSAELISRGIEETAETEGSPVLIVIDTLARNFNGDENAASDMSKFINNVNQYLRDPFECVVLIVHHTGHSEKKRARGSTALRAGIDFEYRVEKGNVQELVAKLICTKMKDTVEPIERWFKGKQVTVDWPEDGEIIDSLVFEETCVLKQEKPLKSELIQFLELANSLADPEGIVDRVQLRERAVADEIVRDAGQVRNYIRTLKDKNIIEVLCKDRIRLLSRG